MIDFTSCREFINSYEGADLKKKIEYDGEVYMLKFGKKLESNDKKPMQASYSSTPVSEYLGSHIYEIAGLPVQDTILGIYDGKVVVACKDFIENRPNADALALVEFKKLENSYLGSSSAGGRTPTYENLIEIFANHTTLDGVRKEAEQRYWQMFAVDSLIGNFDRHAGNWGYILNKSENKILGLAPVYDCGSCFYPQLNEQTMRALNTDRQALEQRVLKFPNAALRLDGKKVNYHDFLLSAEGASARAALGELYPQIDFRKITELMQSIPCISDVRCEFYINLANVRRETILQPAYDLYLKEHSHKLDSRAPEKLSLKDEAESMRKAAKELENGRGGIEPPMIGKRGEER